MEKEKNQFKKKKTGLPGETPCRRKKRNSQRPQQNGILVVGAPKKVLEATGTSSI